MRGKPWAEEHPKGSGRWRGRYRCTCDACVAKAGTPRVLSAPGRYDDHDTALEAAVVARADHRRGITPASPTGPAPDPDRGETVGQFTERWFPTISVGTGTAHTYRHWLNHWILPRWGHIPLNEVRHLDHRAWEGELRREYAKNTVDNLLILFRQIITDAYLDGAITTHPLPQQRRRRSHPDPDTKQPVARPVTAPLDDVLNLVDNLQRRFGHTSALMLLMALFCGMRFGEIRGLTRKHCHLDRPRFQQYVYVKWQMRWFPKRGWVRLPPKNNSRREILLPPFLADLLAAFLDSHDHDLVFPNDSGDPCRTHTFGNRIKACIEGRRGSGIYPEVPALPKLRGFSPHSGRHWHQTVLDEDGHPDTVIAERMGHKALRSDTPGLSSIRGTYSHVTLTMRVRVPKKLQARYEAAQRRRLRTATVAAG